MSVWTKITHKWDLSYFSNDLFYIIPTFMTKLFEVMLAQNIEAGKTKKEIYLH